MILEGWTGALEVLGSLRFDPGDNLKSIPGKLKVQTLDVSDCVSLNSIGAGVTAKIINLTGCSNLTELPQDLDCYELIATGCPIANLPVSLAAKSRIDLTNCFDIVTLPENLRTGSLILAGCTGLSALPEGLDVKYLDISNCTNLTEFPKNGSIRAGRLTAAGCTKLKSLPDWLGPITFLDLRGCSSLTELPEGLKVTAWIDLQNTSITKLPKSLSDTRLMWRGVPVDERIVFRPETIKADEVLRESNAELRRVLLERMGTEKFMLEATPKLLDKDEDKGGERQLLKIAFDDEDEDLVCVKFQCPSTARQYLIRVPPDTLTCKQAIAWMAGFDDPNEYSLIDET